mmetsp:Transcript_11698/g.38489  ORF Transcript_11698/g.38489 Transcript_11698/m.38489 type:complete len:240 (-) Transcript_11698:101-820(-)|eukprot:CAMPEP_0118906544 /NCGR_PEP_ID=MMETSP1166-20130328/10247_1 /TAXON_ID=1104430 /ORGANISM="Chrysoreinhardia sp, Strain CCMP3193" /LENGTH=239 /DNA_ID=CAMNT_0006845863 /DNA_START=77 /DNA_END=796 /DNA_ORIENTATION=+
MASTPPPPASSRPHALMLARGGSKGIPKKNIKPLNGVPLLVYNVKAALASEVFEKVVVSSDDGEILAIAAKAGAVPFRRDPATATDAASSEAGILDYVSKTEECEALCLIQCTSPLTSSSDFRNAWTHFVSGNYDSLVTVVRSHRFLWELKNGTAQPKNYDPAQRPRRQDWRGELVENGAFYIFKVPSFRATNSRLHGTIAAFEMNEATLVEIDSITDWNIVEFLAKDKFHDLPRSWGF